MFKKALESPTPPSKCSICGSTFCDCSLITEIELLKIEKPDLMSIDWCQDYCDQTNYNFVAKLINRLDRNEAWRDIEDKELKEIEHLHKLYREQVILELSKTDSLKSSIEKLKKRRKWRTK